MKSNQEYQHRIDELSDASLLKVIRSKNDYEETFWLMAVTEGKRRGLGEEVENLVTVVEQNKVQSQQMNEEIKKNESALVQLYSERAIIAFSVLFTPFAGALLFYHNVKRLGVKGGKEVMTFGIVYSIGVLVLLLVLPFKNLNSVGYLLNILAGFIINVHYGSKYYPDHLNYKKRSIWVPFLIAAFITTMVGIGIFMVDRYSHRVIKTEIRN